MNTLQEKRELAVWIAHSCFERGKTSGSTANLSFRHDDHVWITRSGTCFGALTTQDFVECSLDGRCLGEGRPSKELPLHLALYGEQADSEAVIHVHSPFATLCSCLPPRSERDVFPDYTPYLAMKAGKVVYIPYAPPGSEELFRLMYARVGMERAYLLAHHGPIVAGKSLMSAFEAVEELEQSAFTFWELRKFEEQTGKKVETI